MAICNGLWVLTSAGLVPGRCLTAWPGIQDDVRNASGAWQDRAVVVDGNRTSSRGQQDLSHLPTGAFKLAVQTAAAAGGDRAILLAYKSNERQVRDKYTRHAEAEHPPHVREILRQSADDEERHYAWVSEVLEELGAGEETMTGAVEEVFETLHARTVDVVESVERRIAEAAEESRRGR